jgi:hypothetical protein
VLVPETKRLEFSGVITKVEQVADQQPGMDSHYAQESLPLVDLLEDILESSVVLLQDGAEVNNTECQK